MGTLSVMGGITALFLPETLWRHLPNTLEESEAFGSHFKICSCPHKRYVYYYAKHELQHLAFIQVVYVCTKRREKNQIAKLSNTLGLFYG